MATATVKERVEHAEIDELPVSRANFTKLQAYVVASLRKLGFQENRVAIEQADEVTGKTGKAIPYKIRIQTRTGVVELLDNLIASPNAEPRGIKWGTFNEVRQKLEEINPDLQRINPQTIMDLLRGGTVCTLPENCRILEDDDAYQFALNQINIVGGGMAALSLGNCYRLFCKPESDEVARNENLYQQAAVELKQFEATMRMQNAAIYIYQPSGIVDGITVCFFPGNVTDLPLTSDAVSEEISTTNFSPDRNDEEDGDLLEIDFNTDLNEKVEKELARLCREDPKVRILHSRDISDAQLTPYSAITYHVPEKYQTRELNVNDLASCFKYMSDQMKQDQDIKPDLDDGCELLIWVEGWRIYAYAVPPSEADEFHCY